MDIEARLRQRGGSILQNSTDISLSGSYNSFISRHSINTKDQSMSAAIPPLPPETLPAGLSEPQRIVNTFISPSRTFEDLKRKSRWFVPWLLISIFSLTFGIIFVHKVDMVRFTREQMEQSPSAAARLEQASPEQRQAQLKIAAKVTEIFFYFAPISTLIGVLIFAAILMAVFNFGFEAGIPYPRYLAIVFYACLPLIISSILVSLVVALNPDANAINIRNAIATNPAYFMDPTSNKFLYGLVSGLDVFRIWITCLLGLGISINAAKGKVSRGTALTTLFVMYVLLIVIGAAWTARG
jgi:Yip1 domain